MQKFKLLAAILAFAAAHSVLAAEGESSAAAGSEGGEHAEKAVTSNIAIVNNFVYRGISQTGGKPAVQGGFDYERGGFYAGVFGSSSSFYTNLAKETGGAAGAANSSVELDTYLGYKSAFAGDFNYDVGFLRYNFPGDVAPNGVSGDTNEIYGGLGYKKWVNVKYSYSLGNTFGIDKAKGTNYIEVNGNVPLMENLTLNAHAGKQTFKGATADALAAAGASPDVTDYKVGVTQKVADFELALAYSKTNAKTNAGYYYIQGKNLGRGAVILSVARTF